MLGVSKTCREIKDRIYKIQQDKELLKAENVKLQELCVDMASHLREAERIHGDELLPAGYITRMQELGIEVK